MSIKAVIFDLGGVILRTEYQAPRQHLAERLGMEYDELVKIVFDSPTAKQATVGEVTTPAHWLSVMKRLKQPASEAEKIREEFFAGDVLDRQLLDFLRSLRSTHKTCLISNAWDDLREYILKEKFEDAFDHMVISAEVKVAKPSAKIYQIALDQLKVSPNEAVFVDDFYENIEACESLGIKGIHFKNPEDALRQLKALL
ncbi:MAG: HAD family phosphatase [Anaerolineales bacterium]|nr:HAD family phosphatase [Anaerolineales bacterium]